VNNLLVPVKNVYAAIYNIHALVGAMAHSKDTLEHLQEARVITRGGGGGTTAASSVRRSSIWRRRGVVADWSLGNSRAKKLMCHILIEPFMSHRLDHPPHPMKDGKVRKNPIDLQCMESIVLDIHRGHLQSGHYTPGVKLLGVVKVRGQPKKLGKLCKLDVEHSAISHQHEDPLFLFKEETEIELCDDFLILVVQKL
jgi:hypothetical protein